MTFFILIRETFDFPEESSLNKDENAHRFALSAIRGELLERERKNKRERKR